MNPRIQWLRVSALAFGAIGASNLVLAHADPAAPVVAEEQPAEEEVEEAMPVPCAFLRVRTPSASLVAERVGEATEQTGLLDAVPAGDSKVLKQTYSAVDLVGFGNEDGTVNDGPDSARHPYTPGAFVRLVRACTGERRDATLSLLLRGGELTIWADSDSYAAVERLLTDLRGHLPQRMLLRYFDVKDLEPDPVPLNFDEICLKLVDSSYVPPEESDRPRLARVFNLDPVIAHIRDCVGSSLLDVEGAVLEVKHGTLIAKNTPEALDQIAACVERLRESRRSPNYISDFDVEVSQSPGVLVNLDDVTNGLTAK